MSEYGPPTDDQIKAYYSCQSRTANWVQSHSSPSSRSSSRPPTTRSSSQQSSSSHITSRARNHSLPPPPPGFKYAPASTPMVYKTQAATYTVVTTKSKPVIVTTNDGKIQPSRRHSTPPVQHSSRQKSHSHSHSHTRSRSPPRHSSTHTSSSSNSRPSMSRNTSKKEKPLLQRLFSLGSSKRRNSTGGSNNGIGIKW